MSQQFPPQERLGDFIQNREVSPGTVETLRKFLCSYEKVHRVRIINAQLPRFYSRTSIHLAAEKGLAHFLSILLKHGGNPNVESSLPDLKQTPLHLAAKGGFWQCIELLLEYGAKFNVEDMHKRTPYDHIRGRPKCNLVVTHYFAKFTIPQRDQSGEETVQSLHKMMEDDNKIELFEDAYNHLPNHYQDLATRWLDIGSCTLLYRACYYSREEAVKLMLKSSEHIPLANLSRSDTPLHCACNNDNIQLVEMLLDHSPQLALICDTIMDRRYSPLHIACMKKGNTRIVEIILQKIVVLLEAEDDHEYSEDSPLDMNIRDADGCTPLYYACYYGHDEIVSMLLKFGHQYKNCQPCDVSITTTLQRCTPLHAAVQRNNLSTLQVILDYHINHKNNFKELVNIAGRPSVDTKFCLLDCFPSARFSMVSSCSITSQEIENANDVFPEKETKKKVSQKLPGDAKHPAKSKPDSHRVKSKPSKVKSHPSIGKARALSVIPTSAISQQQSEVKLRERSQTEYNDDHVSLFLTKDGSFQVQPTERPPENFDKSFDELSITPLAEACARGYSKVVDLLLSAGARDTEGMAVRLAQLTRNHELARTVLCHHCKLIVENPSSDQPLCNLTVDWSGMKITDISGSWFSGESFFFPSSAEDDEGNDLPMTSLSVEPDVSMLTNIVLKENNLSLLPVELFQLPNLESLDLSSNHITNISSHVSSYSLKFLCLSNNKLIKLPVNIWYLPSLEELRVKGNILQYLEERKDSVDPCKLSKSLKIVDISKNDLNFLPPFVLELPALEELNVSENKLAKLPSEVWESQKLKELNASNNVLSELFFCELQKTLTLSLPDSNAALKYGQRVLGAKMNVRFQTNTGVIQKRHTNKFVNHLETPQEVYSEEYIYDNEGCCSIEKLLLCGNKLSVFPDALPCLAPLLLVLDVSYNNIEEIDVSFLPPMLRKLVASNNKIKKFGNFIDSKLMYSCYMNNEQKECHHRVHKKMKNLVIIDLAHNQLKHFQLIQSKQADDTLHSAVDRSQLDLLYPELENLNISNNRLQGCFNHNIGYQSQLKSITLSGNVELEELPMEFAYFKKSKKFTQLLLHNLPKLRDPPKEYHDKFRSLLSYMNSRLKKSEYYRYIKLIVVGCGERGKTTLLHRLRGLPYDNINSTVGIDIEPWTYGPPGQPPIIFMTWDFAGQDVYNTTHQCFYSQRSLYLALYRLNDKEGIAELDSWLRNIKLRAPGSPVIVIGTHLDQVTEAVAKESEARVREQYSNAKLYPTIVDVCSVSCVKKGHFKKVIRSTIDQFRTTIYKVATHLRVAPDGLKLTYDQKMSITDPECLFQQKIPQSYLKLQESVIDTMKTNDKPPVMRSDEFREKFLSIMDDEEELSDAVQYLHHQGTLLHFTDQALKDVYFLDPQWLCKMMASVIRVTPAGEESIAKNGSVDINNLFTESKELQTFKDECINLLSKFDIALRLKNNQLLVPSLLPVDPLTCLPSCINSDNQLLNDTHSDNSENVFYPPLWKFWFSKFIPNGFWPRLICRLTTNQNANTILKCAFPLLLDDCGPHSSKDDMFLPWTLWRSGLALTYKKTLLLEVKEALNYTGPYDHNEVKDSQFRVEACVNIPGWVAVTKQLSSCDSVADHDIVGLATSLMVEIVRHISSLATDWFPGMFIGYFIEGQVPCYVPCWKCCYQHSDNVKSDDPCLEQGMAAFSIERGGHIVYCWEFDNIIIPAITEKPIWCDVHSSIDTWQVTPELLFRDLGDYDKNRRYPLWIDKERALGKGAFGVVLRGEFDNQESDKTSVAIKVLLPEADSKLEQQTLEEVLRSTSANGLIPQSYYNVRQEVSILARLQHDNLAKLCGVRITPIIPGTTPVICLLLELASKSSLRDVLKKYKAAKMLLEPKTLKVTICQIASGLDYLHQHEIAHLDIKSPNILVWKFPMQFSSRQDRLEHATEVLVKIADYGTSQTFTLHGIRANNSIGTPGYMAPELFSHKGQEIFPDKVDAFAFGITIFELLSMRPPFDEVPQKDANTLHRLVREGKRPLLTQKEVQSPVLIQDMMQMCWEHEPNNRPSMSQVLQWAESIEFDSLRVDSNLAQVTAISTACVSRIHPAFDDYLKYNGDDLPYTLMKSQTITQESVTKSVVDSCSSDNTENSTIQPRGSRDTMGYRRVGSISEIRLLGPHAKPSACTQIWLCGQDKRKGLVAIFTYEDDKPGYSLFYGYACEQEIKVICAVYNYMWLGNANGELRIIHAPTMKTKFVRSLNSKDSLSDYIFDIVHVKAHHKVMVSTRNDDVWIFSDALDKGSLRFYSRLQFSDGYPLFHMTVVDVNGSAEVWGTSSDNKVMVLFQHQQLKWDYSEMQCESFSSGRKLTVALATNSVFTGKYGESRSHVWVSFNRRAYIVCWDAVKKKQLHVVDCKEDMHIDEQGLYVSALLASGQFVYAGTTVGVIGVWSSEDAMLLQIFHYHEHKVRMLLEMPLQVSPCVCPEEPFPKDKENINDASVYDNNNHLITSIGKGRKKLFLCSSSTGHKRHQQRRDDDICLLTWQCWKQES